MQSKQKSIFIKIAISLIGLIVLAFYARFLYHLALATSLDSDYSNLVLEANDIVKGNPFLTGWNQTGVSFLLTDIPYFVIGNLFFGLSKMAYIVAISLMFICTMITTFFLTDYKKIKNNLLFFALVAFPTVQVFELLRAHTGGFILTFLILIVIDYCMKQQAISNKYAVLMALFVAMISMSDAASLLFGTFAIIIICLYKIIFDKQIYKKLYYKLLGIMVIGTISGMVLDKLYYAIGGANKNSFLGAQSIIPINKLLDKIYVYLDSVFVLAHANVFGSSIFALNTVVNAVYFPIVLIGFYLVYKNIKLFLKNNNDDLVSTAISIGFVLVSLSFILTTVGIDIYSSRYFATLPFFFAVLICRYIKNNNLMDQSIYTSKIKWKYLVIAFSIISLFGSFIVTNKNIKSEFITEQEGIVGFLKDNNLKNGFASYWDSSVEALTSKGEINIRQITIDEDKASKLNWFCKDDWYQEDNNFVLIHNPELAGYGVTEENISLVFGKPNRVLTCGQYVIYIYNYNLSSKLVH